MILSRLFKRDRRERAKTPTDDEIRVIRLLLSGVDERGEKLLQQVLTTPHVLRESPSPDRYVLTVSSTRENLLIRLEQELESESVEVREAASKRALSFRLRLCRGGFLGALEGRTLDGGPWPRLWRVDEPSLVVPTAPYLHLPDAAKARKLQQDGRQRLSQWLGSEHVGRDGRLSFFAPASDDEIEELERRLGVTLPDEYGQFVLLTNGLGVAKLEILGTRDAYALEGMVQRGLGSKHLLLASLGENGVIGLRMEGEHRGEVILLEPSDGMEPRASALASTFREFLIRALAEGRAGK